MSLLEAVLLGLVQGLTEFLPVSSSGHLVIVQHFLPGFQQPGLLFDLLLHLGTVGAACIYFRRELKSIIGSLLPGAGQSGPEAVVGRKLAWLIVLASVPTAVIGLAFKKQFTLLFERPGLAAAMLLITAALLWSADRIPKAQRSLEQMGWREALLIGTVQGLAIIPGISRSGSTIAVGIYCKLDRNLAARYSFLLMIPAVLGASLLEARHLLELCRMPGNFGVLLAGTLTALIVSYLTIDVLMRLVRQKRLSYFAYYCLAVGLGTLLVLVCR